MNNKKVKVKIIRFKDYPEFRPNLTPRQMFLLGSFGGTYWRPITSKVTNKSYKNQHKEFPKSWWKGIPNKWLTSPIYDLSINNYGVKSGTSLRFWEKKGWMNKQDPYGWVQWYCRFYKGRRTPDDKRQIKRWLAFAGPKGRFKRRIINMIKKKKTKYNDYTVSPVIRQGLQHWAYRLVPSDVRKKPVKKRNFGKKTFLYNPDNPKTSFDVYINKNPKDTIPIKYTSVKDVKDTIRKLERLYKAKKYPHTRIWKVGMILKVRLEAMVKHTGKKKIHFKHSKNYFHFLGQRTTKSEPERRKMVFKFNKTYRKVNKVKRKRKFGTKLVVGSSGSSGSFKFDQPYYVLHDSDGSFLKKETLTLNTKIENLKNKLLDKWEENPKETIDRNFTAKKYSQLIPFMPSTNEEIEVTKDGRLFFTNGLYEIEGNIDLIIGKDGKHYWPENKEIREWQKKTFNKLESRKDILPYPLDKFLQAFKESKGQNLALAKYIVILSKNNFPYDEYEYRTTLRHAKKMVSFYYPKVKFGKTLLPKLRKLSKKNVKHVYKLKDPQKKRILAIDEGIRAEAKKTGRNMKQAAISKKARFNILRIYRKNKKLGECNKLTRDMRYIDKKYKLGKTTNICN